MRQKMRVGIARLKNEPQTCLVQDLQKAAATLCRPSYEHYMLAAERAMNDLLLEEEFKNKIATDLYC